MKITENQIGFTLIELLVVISIIGLLSSIILVGTKSARINAFNTMEMQNVNQISKALELYYDANGHYPWFSGFSYATNNGIANNSPWTELTQMLAPYIILPKATDNWKHDGYYAYYVVYNPSPSGLPYLCYYSHYKVAAGGQGYMIVSWPVDLKANQFSLNDGSLITVAMGRFNGVEYSTWCG